jgi:DNA repair exonuclease SbcCD nuclease subunit
MSVVGDLASASSLSERRSMRRLEGAALVIRFVHTSDWQLGKPFGKAPDDARAALQEARLDAIGALASAARTHGAAFVLVAGDVFDSAEPGDRVFRQALSRMAGAADLRWILLPGNHDPARADGLWSRLAAEAPPNVVAATEPTPLAVLEDVYLLPAPLAFKRTVQDPTAWFDGAETPTGARRLGLAHGSIQDFGVGETATNQIAPDRARRAGLDYLALGDWHSRRQIDARTAYCGTPEPDDFGREASGEALVVELAPPGEAPRITPVPIGRYQWVTDTWTLSAAADLDSPLAALSAGQDLKHLVARIKLAGLLTLGERVAVRERLEAGLAHEVRWLDLSLADLFARPTDNDLAEIDAQGVLREAAERLRALAGEPGEQGLRAMAALERLYVEHQKAQRIGAT